MRLMKIESMPSRPINPKVVSAMNMLRKWSAITLACVIAASMVLLAGCAEKSDQSQSEYADEAFIQSLAKGYEARDTLVGQSSKAEKSAEYYEKLVDAELEQVEQYQSAQFSDSKLQENAIAYINALKDQRAAAELYATDNSKYKQDWQNAYDKRTALLKTFVDNYGFAVSPEHQDSLDKLVSHGKKVERDNNQKEAIESLASSINLEFTERYSTFVGQATATNNTGYDFDYIAFDVELFDSSGVKVETASLYANHWLDGETIALDCYTSIKELPSTVKVIPSNYKVADA